MKTIEMLEGLKAELDEAIAEYQKKAGDALTQIYAEFFETAPMIQQFYWRQYTPFFNDGEACVFNVHDVEFNILATDDRDYEGTYQSAWSCKYNKVKTNLEYHEKSTEDGAQEIVAFLKSVNADSEMERHCEMAVSSMNSFINSNEDLMLAVYGDHVEVVVSKQDGKITVEVGEHAHD